MEEKELIIKEISSLKDEVSANVVRTILFTYTTGVGALGLALKYSDYPLSELNNYFTSLSNVVNNKYGIAIPISLLAIGIPLTACSIKGIVVNSKKVKEKEKEYKLCR